MSSESDLNIYTCCGRLVQLEHFGMSIGHRLTELSFIIECHAYASTFEIKFKLIKLLHVCVRRQHTDGGSFFTDRQLT
jgi:hypothetical protein